MGVPTNKRIWYAELDTLLTTAAALKGAYIRRCAAIDTPAEDALLFGRAAEVDRYVEAADETDRDDLMARIDELLARHNAFVYGTE